MDPVACWNRVVEALLDGDYEEAANAMDDLCKWLSKSGFNNVD